MSYVQQWKDKSKGERQAREEVKRYNLNSNCEDARKNVAKLKLIIAQLSKDAINSDVAEGKLNIYRRHLIQMENTYKFGNCENKEEEKKLKEVEQIINTESKDYEQTITAQTVQQNKIVIYFGAAIMILGVIMILRK